MSCNTSIWIVDTESRLIVSTRTTTLKTKDTNELVKTWPALHGPASRQGALKLLRLWYLLRALDPPGSGRLPISSVYGKLSDILHRETVRQTLREGDGEWWDLYIDEGGTEYVAYRSLLKIAVVLGLKRFGMPAVYVPIYAFTEGFSRFAGYMLSAWIEARSNNLNPISKATLAEEFGTSQKTIYNWMEASGIVKKKNYTETLLSTLAGGDVSDEMKDIYTKYVDAQAGDAPTYIVKVKGEHGNCLRWQIANTYYQPDVERGARGQGIRANNALKRLLSKGTCSDKEPADRLRRRYFKRDETKSYSKLVLRRDIHIENVDGQDLPAGYWNSIGSYTGVPALDNG